jgi:hypothetical protein
VDHDPALIERYAVQLWGLASDVELALIRRVARALAQGIDAPGWVELKLAQVVKLRSGIEVDVAGFLGAAQLGMIDAVGGSAEAGHAAAAVEMQAAVGATVAASATIGAPAMSALAAEASGLVASTRMGILRASEDIYRTVVSRVASHVLTGTQTRRGIAQLALDRLVGRGVSGFVDRSGRRWELASYVEVATRTVAQRAMTQAHGAALQSRGIDLVIVSDAPQECGRCRRWENKVLSLSGGGAGRLSLPSAVDPSVMVTVEVAGSLDHAKHAGLYHPNCRHSHSAYLPGLTKPARSAPADPEGDKARVRLRALERTVRAAKMREAAAMDDMAAASARARVRAGQAAIREHVAATPGLLRQPAREQIGRAR